MNNYPKHVSEKQIEIPDFLKVKEPVIDEGCSEVIATVQREMAREVSGDLEKVRNGQEIMTENKREKIRTTVNAWTEQEQKEVCRIIPSDILLEVIGEGIKELNVMKKEIAALSRHYKGV